MFCARRFLILLFAAATEISAQTGSVTFSMGNGGISSLRFGGTDYLSYGDFRVNAVKLKTPAGAVVDANLASTLAISVSSNEFTRRYNWGTIRVAYTATGTRLTLAITTTNTSSNTISAVSYEPLGIRFPSKPAEYDGSIPILGTNIGQPTVLPMTYAGGVLALSNDDVAHPLLAGFPWALDRPAPMLIYPLRINTGREVMYPDSLPFIDRSISPGSSDTFRLSLRFLTSGTRGAALAPDVYSSFSAVYPYRLNWPDRRPIGSLILATAAAGWSTNPRGWLLDPSINVNTPAGVAALRTRVLQWADNAIRILKNMNAQGMVTWDIEGEQFPHATTYLGDPRQFATLAPEMSGIADDYFRKFRDAGLLVGVCIRPQQLVFSADGRSAQQTDASDPAAVLIDKISFAKTRWGAKLFYVDSNGDPGSPMDVAIFKRVAAAHPDVLLIPEHENLSYFSLTAPYNELRSGVVSTPPLAREVYPSAFSVINTADGPIEANFLPLRASVASGDMMMFRGWFDDPGNAVVKSLYPFVPDRENPTVSFLAPVSNSQLSGETVVRISATDNVSVSGVRLLLDGSGYGAEALSSPWEIRLDTQQFANGPHTLTAVARDGVGNSGMAMLPVMFLNLVSIPTPPTTPFPVPVPVPIPAPTPIPSPASPDTTAPVIVITSPGNNSETRGLLTFAVAATDNIGVAGVRYLVDGVIIAESKTSPFSVTWNSTAVRGGTHYVRAEAYDNAGNKSGSEISLTVNNIEPPSCNVPGVRSFVGCYYTGTDFSGLNVARIDDQISFDWNTGGPLSAAPSAPFSARWNGDFPFENGGQYRFNVRATGGWRLFVDDSLVADYWQSLTEVNTSVVTSLSAGTHRIRIDYLRNVPQAIIQFSWNRL